MNDRERRYAQVLAFIGFGKKQIAEALNMKGGSVMQAGKRREWLGTDVATQLDTFDVYATRAEALELLKGAGMLEALFSKGEKA